MVEPFWTSQYLLVTREPLEECLRGALAELSYSTALLVVDENIPPDVFATGRLESAGVRVSRIACGEERKQFARVPAFLAEHQTFLDQRSLVIAVGGGSLLDFVGFCCGILYRGIGYISVPSSVTAMADAAYGGKTAVSLGTKNQIGVYHHPRRVYVDFRLLRSLPEIHARAGAVEIAKLGFFYPEIAEQLARAELTDPASVSDAILLAAKKKLELVRADPKEESAAAVLLYGHAFSNAFETYAWERKETIVPHGFAVGMGICFSAFLEGRLDGRFANLMSDRLKLLSRWVDLPAVFGRCVPEDADEMVGLLERDKYAANGLIRLPALFGASGYTQIPLEMVRREFEPWRRAMKGNKG